MMTTRSSGLLLVVLLPPFGAGCGKNDIAGGGEKPGTRPPAERAGGLRSELLYARSGGFVGTDDRVSIQPDGSLRASGRLIGEHAGKLSATQFAQLAPLLEGWPTLQVTGRPPKGAADLFEYSITYAGKTLSWTSATPNVPEGLVGLARTIEELARTVK